jgi:hypothetical protein
VAVVNGIRIALEREPVLNCPKIAVVQATLVPAASGPARPPARASSRWLCPTRRSRRLERLDPSRTPRSWPGPGLRHGHEQSRHSSASCAPGHPEKLIDFGYRASHEMTKEPLRPRAQALLLHRLLGGRQTGPGGSATLFR